MNPDLLARAFTTVSADWARHNREITIVTRLHVNRTRTKETCRTSKPEQAEIQRSGAEGPDVARSVAAKFRLQQNVPPDDDVTVDTDTGDVPVPPTVSPRGQRGVGLALKLNRQNATRDCS